MDYSRLSPGSDGFDMFDTESSLEHDYGDPDHVDSPFFDKSNVGDSFSLDTFDDPERVVRHRKVYVSERKDDDEPIIHPLSLTIPVKVPEYSSSEIPEPKPIYRLHKYTTYENRPEIQMMPVTKTIIKPLGVSPDQIIDDEKNLMPGSNMEVN